MTTTNLHAISGVNLIRELDKALAYAKRESSPIEARRTHATRANEIVAELRRRAATGDERYAAFAA